jgi:fatty acid/phospholipid biosynthesis enzyme
MLESLEDEMENLVAPRIALLDIGEEVEEGIKQAPENEAPIAAETLLSA